MLVEATDAQNHFKQLNDLNAFFDNANSDKSLPEKKKTMCWLLKCADISIGFKGKD